ncbi:MAG: glutamine synthetase family protein [Alphaproteobacteria bacterium]|nr:glutamine synthetase family protein [Alphaproteobacteria bacterium]
MPPAMPPADTPPTTRPEQELDAFLEAHPDIRVVDMVMIDQLGAARGKRIPVEEARGAYRDGFRLPGSVLALDATGETVEASGLLWEDGDADRVCHPIPGSLLRQSWDMRGAAMVQLAMRDHDGTPFYACPRERLIAIEARLADLGLTPVVALEFEFYLLSKTRDERGAPLLARAPGRSEPPQTTAVYALDDLRDFDAVLSDIAEACRDVGIPAAAATTEAAPGQFEINLHHVPGAVHAADLGVRFKQVVKGVANLHGMDATFMSKPFHDLSGNGLHAHISLIDGRERNIFADEDPHGSPALRHAIQGLADTMAEFTALFAPHANAYRRMQPGSYAPVSPCWGVNNRTLALRIPSSSPAARRIEHRVAGGDANVYLTLGAILAGMHKGLTDKIDPPPPTTGNGYEAHDPSLPLEWNVALEAFRESHAARRYFGDRFVDLYYTCREHERRAFEAVVTPLEWQWYLRLS